VVFTAVFIILRDKNEYGTKTVLLASNLRSMGVERHSIIGFLCYHYFVFKSSIWGLTVADLGVGGPGEAPVK
jgi:hypothetical protein